MNDSALGGEVVETVTSSTFAVVCQEGTRANVKTVAAKKTGVPLVKRDWLDWLIVHV